MEPILQIESLAIGYRVGTQIKTVLENLNCSIFEGELICIIGENGIGKSSLLRTLVNLQPALQGKVMIYGKNIKKVTKKELAQTVSFVSTEPVRLQNCTVERFVSYGRYPYTNWFGQQTRNDIEKVHEAISLVGLNHLALQPITEISDGERQKVMIARSLAQDTPVIYLDEPTAFLDMGNKYEILHLLGELTRTQKKTIIFSSHDLHAVMKEADRLWLISRDRFIIGAPEDLVLNSSIAGIFSNSELKFNSLNGEFSIKRNPKCFCTLEGSGLHFEWTRKSLERIGIETNTNNEDISFTITVQENNRMVNWTLLWQQDTLVYNSIYELTSFLKSKIYH